MSYYTPRQIKVLLNCKGFYYSGDRNDFGLNWSSKNGESYDIWGNSWRHYSGASGEDIESLLAHIDSTNFNHELCIFRLTCFAQNANNSASRANKGLTSWHM